MALAFWRDKRATTEKRNVPASRSRADAGEGDPTAALKVRARRRLIGAAALLLAAAILVPLLLDPAPRPTTDNIPIEIPSEKAPFTPRLSLPPVPDPGQVPVAPAPDMPASDAEAGKGSAPAGKSDAGAGKSEPGKAEAGTSESTKSTARPATDTKTPAREAPPAKTPESKTPLSKAPEPKATATRTAEPKATEAKPRPVAESRAADSAAKTKSGRILLQAAALSTDAAAQDLSERLRKAGFTPFTEKVDTADGVRYRVRVGPYPTRDEAQRAQARLRALGVSATLVTT